MFRDVRRGASGRTEAEPREHGVRLSTWVRKRSAKREPDASFDEADQADATLTLNRVVRPLMALLASCQ